MPAKVAVAVVLLSCTMTFAKTPERGHPCPDPAGVIQTHQPAPVIQLAILLDTSNSMDGLIDQARSQLWKIVNEMADARRGDKPARLEVALYEYGNDRLSASSGHVRRVLPFTTDLDRLSEELFSLKTNGGSEFCGTVIQAALDELRWSASPSDLKVVFIAGNEPFSQGPVDYRKACRRAQAEGVVVNTIHCGSRDVGEQTGWSDGASLAAGAYSVINQNRAVEHVAAPQDADIARLGVELNRTYVPYGSRGQAGQGSQVKGDQDAMKSAGGATQRALTKANRHYSNSSWDLVDAVENAEVDLEKLKEAELPAELRPLKAAERKAYLRGRAYERKRLQVEIQKLNAARAKHVAQVQRTKAAPGDETLDVVVAKALRGEAACKGITLD